MSLVPFIHFSFDTAQHAATGCSPFFILCERIPNLPLNLQASDLPSSPPNKLSGLITHLCRIMLVHQKVQQQLENSWKTQKLAFDKRSWTKAVEVGYIIYYTQPHSGPQFQKFQPLFQGLTTVLEVYPNNVIKVLKESGQSITLHVDRVKLATFGEQLQMEPALPCPSPPLWNPLCQLQAYLQRNPIPYLLLTHLDCLPPHVTFNPWVTVVRPC